MIRICSSLAAAGYDVTLVGRQLPRSVPLKKMPFRQKRLKCFFNKGFLFYGEYNFRLFFFLLFQKMHAICAIDLDTILPCLLVSKIKGVPRIYDAHEYFTEMKEVRTRPRVKKFWLAIEKFCVPRFRLGYTVSSGLAEQFRENYGRQYEVIRNLPVLRPLDPTLRKENILLYQGAVNEARGFEYLIPAMKQIPYRLVICGDGNFMGELKALIQQHGVAGKVELKGMMLPEDMWPVAQQAMLGLGLAEKEGINQFQALPNKFTEYMHAGLAQIAMNYPEYQKINEKFKVAVLLDDLSVDHVAETINRTMEDKALLEELRANALRARDIYCWQEEEKKLIQFYKNIPGLE